MADSASSPERLPGAPLDLLASAQANANANANGEGGAEHDDEGETTPVEAGSSSATPAAGGPSKKKKKKGKGKASAAAAKLKAQVTTGTTLESRMTPELHQTIIRSIREQNGGDVADRLARLDPGDLAKMLDQLKIMDVVQGKSGIAGKGTKDMADHKFWRTQPVRRLDENDDDFEEGEIEPSKSEQEIRQQPIPLPDGYEWVTMDLSDPSELKEVYELLTANYVEDNDATFRFDYSAPFINWALRPPDYVKEWHVGVRVATGKRKLIAFIAGIPMNLRVRAAKKACVEINFLCIHKKLRSKRLAPVLIKEVTRRCNLKGIFQAIYTAGVFLPTPISRCQYFHRNLNPNKLVATGFSTQPRGVSMARMNRQYKCSDAPLMPGFREMEESDVEAVTELLRAYMERLELAPELGSEEVVHGLIRGRGEGEVKNGRRTGQVVWTYVVESPETKTITDVVSFYNLPSTAMKTTPHQTLDAAYLYYYATTAAPACSHLASNSSDASVASPAKAWSDETPEERKALKKRLTALIADALSVAQTAGFDVFNALTLMDNTLFLQELQFGAGDGYLHYYLYNWKVHTIQGGLAGERGAPQDPGSWFGEGSGSGVGVVML